MRNAINVISFLVIGISVLLIWHFKSETEDNVNKLNRASAELVMIAINNFYSKNADYPEDINQLMDYISHPDSLFYHDSETVEKKAWIYNRPTGALNQKESVILLISPSHNGDGLFVVGWSTGKVEMLTQEEINSLHSE